MNPTAIYSKTGKGVQEASGRTSHLSRADRAVLSAIDGKSTVAELNQRFEKIGEAKFQQLIEKMDKDGFVREVSPGTPLAQARPAAGRTGSRPAIPPPPAPRKQEEDDDGGELDFTSFIPTAPRQEAEAAKAKASPGSTTSQRLDLAAKAHAEAERKAQEEAFDFKAREQAAAKAKEEAAARAKAEAEAKAKAEAAAKEKAEADARAKAAAEARAKAEAEAKSKVEAEAKAKAKARADSEAKSKALRDAAIRAASEARQKAEAEAKAKAEAEERANKEAEERARIEQEMNAKLEAERKAREDAEQRVKEEAERAAKEAEERARREVEEKASKEADALRQQLEAERKAREEIERKAREEEARRHKEAEEAKRREAEEARRKEEEERKRKEAEEARRREAEEAKRKEAEEARRKEAEEAKRKEAEEAKRREAEEAKRKEAEEAKRREAEEAKRKEAEEAKRKEAEEAKRREAEEAKRKEAEEARRKEAEEAKRKESEEARRKEEEERKRKQAEEDARRETEEEIRHQTAEAARRKEADEARRRAQEEARRKAERAPAASALSDDLLADLDSFARRDEEEQKAREAAERKAKEDTERKAREAEARKRQEEQAAREREAQARRREEAEARAQAEAERAREAQAREEAERRQREAQEAAVLAAQSMAEDDIEISDEDLDMDEVRSEERLLSKSARKAESKRAREESEVEPAAPAGKSKGKKLFAFGKKEKKEKREKKKKAEPLAPKEVQAERIRRRKLGKPLAVGAVLLLVAGVGVLHVMPMPTGNYESAASASLGVPVKISSAGMSLIGGLQVTFEGVAIGGGADTVRAARARAFPDIGALLSSEKAFSRIELERAVIPQSVIAQGLLGGLKGGAMRIETIVLQNARFEGPIPLPALDVTLTIAGDGRVLRATVSGSDGIDATLTPQGKEIGVEAKADALNLPFLKGVTLADVGLKGSATRDGLRLSGWDARLFDGVISGNGELRWGAQWSFSGDLIARGVNAAVLTPALLSEGKAEAKGRFSMSGANAAALGRNAQVQGSFTINKGVLGSFDLSRAIQTKGKQSTGRTLFSELTGEGVYQAGAVSLRNLNMGAGKLNAAGSLEIAPSGEVNGRVVADVESGPRAINETFSLVGTIKEPRLSHSAR